MGTFKKDWKDIEIIFTVDEFILIYMKEGREKFEKPIKKLCIEWVNIKKYEDKMDDKIYLVEIKTGYVFNSSTEILVKF
jgi:hypothetical protein